MDLQMSLQNQTSVALLLTMHLLLTDAKDTNCVFSPLSVQMALSSITSGAKGSTLNQLLSFLKSPSSTSLASLASRIIRIVLADGSKSGGPKLLTGTRLWLEKSLSLKPSFRQTLQTSYNAIAIPADFINKAEQVRVEANTWGAKQTNGLIPEILPRGSVTDMTKFILVNAIYFKGAWKSKFDAAATDVDDFHLLKGGVARVPFMSSSKDEIVGAYDGFKVARMPYYQGNDKRQFSMYIFLPDAVDGLPQLISKVLSDPKFLSQHLPQQQVDTGIFKIPRFKISFGFEATRLLKGMGLTAPFSDQADFSNVFDSPRGPRVSISNIFHEAIIKVNEEGTEAAAVTAVVASATSVSLNSIDFVADHPFLFIIREDTSGAILFTGQVFKPSETV